MADDTLTPMGPSLMDIIRQYYGRPQQNMPILAGTPQSLQTTMPPAPVQEVIKGMAEPLTSAGWLLGGALQGTERPSAVDVLKAAGGLGLAAMPMGPGRASGLARGVEAATEGGARALSGVERAGPRIKIDVTPYAKRSGGAGGEPGMAAPSGAPEATLSAPQPVYGLPQAPIDLGEHGTFTPKPFEPARAAAADYAKSSGLEYNPPQTYAKVDPERAKRIAQAFEEMPHDPDNPAVQKSYNALISETNAQWEAIKKTGLKVDFIDPGMPDPYAKSPRLAQKDVHDNNHLWVYPTDVGFGSGGEEAAAAMKNNPMLRPAGEINGRPVLANDIFRIVHDYFGHIKEGHGFRAAGEENAWRSHSAMYSPEARPAMTAETRGQNSWVNYGPHVQNNKTASAAETVYAPQKIGLMPDWVMNEGRGDNPITQWRARQAADPMMQEQVPEAPPVQARVGPQEDLLAPARQVDTSVVDPFGYATQGKPFTQTAQAAMKEVEALPKGSGPMDLSYRSNEQPPQTPLQRYVPPRGASPRIRDALMNPDVISGVHESIRKGISLGADKWYHTDAIAKSFKDELGPEEGTKAFKQFTDLVAATSPRSDVPTNVRNASFYYSIMRNRGVLPESLPYPYGHIAQRLHRSNYAGLQGGGAAGADVPGGWNVIKNPKPASFAENLRGNLEPGTMDTHAFRNIGMRTGDPRFLAGQVSEVVPKGRAPSEFMQKYGEVETKPNGKTIATYRPRQLHDEGRMTMKEMREIPAFWDAQPKANEYAAVEDFYKHAGTQHGLPTADTQAAAWAGGGELTGLGTVPDKTFSQMLNERVLYTAKVRNEDPKKTLKMFIRGQKPLLTTGGLVAAASGAPPLSKRGQ